MNDAPQNPTGWIWSLCCLIMLLPTVLALLVYRFKGRLAKRRAVIVHTKDEQDGRSVNTWRFEVDDREIVPDEEIEGMSDD